MKVVYQALYTLFNTANTFKTAVNGQFYPGFADQERATFPYAVYFLVTDVSDWTFSEDIERLSMQISIFDDSNSPTTILTAYEYMKSLFDDATLSVSGYTHVYMHRQQTTMIRDDQMGTWHSATEYEIEIRK